VEPGEKVAGFSVSLDDRILSHPPVYEHGVWGCQGPWSRTSSLLSPKSETESGSNQILGEPGLGHHMLNGASRFDDGTG
jgi:hypothetical protein